MILYVFVSPHFVLVDDEQWTDLFPINSVLGVGGGVRAEHIEDTPDGYRRFRLRDPYYPPMICKVLMAEAEYDLVVLTDDSPNEKRAVVKLCGHSKMVRDCESCWYRFWKQIGGKSHAVA